MFLGCSGSSTTGSSIIGPIGSTGPFVILFFGLALDLALGFGFGLTSSSSIISLSFIISSLLIISSTSSLDPLLTSFDHLYII